MRRNEKTSIFRRTIRGRVALCALLGAVAGLCVTPPQSQGAELVSVSTSGDAGTSSAGWPDSTLPSFGGRLFSAPGMGIQTHKYVAFQSVADDLVSGGADNNTPQPDIYVRNLDTGATKLVSFGTDGKSGSDGGSYRPKVPRSMGGIVTTGPQPPAPMVAFESDASLSYNPAQDLTDSLRQIYVKRILQESEPPFLITKSAVNPSLGAVGDSRDVAWDAAGRVLAFTFKGSVAELYGLENYDSSTNPQEEIIIWRDGEDPPLSIITLANDAGTVTANGHSFHATVSGDGKCVVYESYATNIAGSISGSGTQVYAYFIDEENTYLVSKKSANQGGNGNSYRAAPNHNCSAIAFESQATNLVPAGVTDANGSSPDVFVWHKSTQAVSLVSKRKNGTGTGDGQSVLPVVPYNNTDPSKLTIAFESQANDLVEPDDAYDDVFVWTATASAPATGTLSLVSTNHRGTASSGGWAPSIFETQAGPVIAFRSDAEDLLPKFENPSYEQNIWVKYPGSPLTVASSSNDGSGGGDDYSFGPVLHGGGVVFESDATNLAASGSDGNQSTDVFAAFPASFSITPSATTVNEADGSFDVTVTRAPGSNMDEVLRIHLVADPPQNAGDAEEDLDFTLGFVTLEAGETSGTATVELLQDYLAEGTEELRLNGVATSGYAIRTGQDAEIKITDDDEDADEDGVNDESDNCPDDANSDQLDSDADGQGNVCDSVEGVCNNLLDDDADGLVDCDDSDCSADIVCAEPEADDDGDGVGNANDNCPEIWNDYQWDTDADGLGDECDDHEDACGNFWDDDQDGSADCQDEDCATDIACAAPEADDDGDGVVNGIDNCPLIANGLQEDTDSDGFGDVCDNDEGVCNDGADNDNDGKVDCDDENCGLNSICAQPDEDTDMDEVPNALDNCPFVENTDQNDTDGDGIGNLCDQQEGACGNQEDDDFDGKVDCEDEHCMFDPVCADPTGDVDEDGATNADDNCPNVENADQADTDGDGIGDACDTTPDGPVEIPEPEPQPEPQPEDEAGCSSCGVASTPSSGWAWGALVAALGLLRRRRSARA